MASGKKNYFRHSFFARNDTLILDLIDKFGLPGYFYFFALLEVCGELAAEEYPEEFVIHASRLRKELRITTRRLNQYLTFLQDRSHLTYTLNDNAYHLIIPNFRKWLGKYSTKKEPNSTKERKEKESKEKKRKENIISNEPGKVSRSIPKGAVDFLKLNADVEEFLETVSVKVQLNWTEIYGDEAFIKTEILKAVNWCLSNPSRKPKSNYARFLSNWLERGYERFRKSNPSNTNTPSVKSKEQELEDYEQYKRNK